MKNEAFFRLLKFSLLDVYMRETKLFLVIGGVTGRRNKKELKTILSIRNNWRITIIALLFSRLFLMSICEFKYDVGILNRLVC
ncbi:hypothetical protein SAMN05444274_102295 [Mariniphaga anaerophila]|uniref:Uncharacterized protein n=1 Tax=Mariniphaga anaerophila TaxID=1484053 RepID=A0A1M4W3B7_9BACT|nr:hypothetical protein SAMN05444274_102295 [Mariniphaga anaerophila]